MSLFQGEAIKGKKALRHGKVPLDAWRCLIPGPLRLFLKSMAEKEGRDRPGHAETQPADTTYKNQHVA